VGIRRARGSTNPGGSLTETQRRRNGWHRRGAAISLIVSLYSGMGPYLRPPPQSRVGGHELGTATRTLARIYPDGTLWWEARKIRVHEQALREARRESAIQATQLSGFLGRLGAPSRSTVSAPEGTNDLWANEAELTVSASPAGGRGSNIVDFHVDPEVLADILARLHAARK